MEIVETTLPGPGFDALIRSHRDGDVVVVTVGGLVFVQWSTDDLPTRDLFLVTGHHADLDGKTLAHLAGISEAQVSRVLSHFAIHGWRGLVERGAAGRAPALGPVGKAKARALREQGVTLADIAEQLGVGIRSVRTATAGVVVRPGPTPIALPSAPPAADRVVVAAEDDAPSIATVESSVSALAPAADDAVAAPSEPGKDPLGPAAPLAADGRWHACRYAGTTLIAAGVLHVGLRHAMGLAAVARPDEALYSGQQALVGLASAWAAGFPSIEAMHERDARALGVVLGLERSPSVRTLWRAIAQMVAGFDRVQWWVGWMQGLLRVHVPEVPVYGIDGHFKAYGGEEPIDKGYNTKRRIAERGLATVRLMDLHGFCWNDLSVAAGDGLHAHVLAAARALVAAQRLDRSRVARPVVLAFDRGGFDFAVLSALSAEGFWFLAWVPSTVKLPDLGTIAPPEDGIGEVLWDHPRCTHPTRLLVERDGKALLPATTNLPTWIDATEAMRLLRGARGMEENGIKAAKAFVPIDHLDDRGAVNHRPDDRPANNPARTKLQALSRELKEAEMSLRREHAAPTERRRAEVRLDLDVNVLQQRVVKRQIRETPEKVPRVTIQPEAVRAELDVSNRALLLPLKNATENARRWLLARLGGKLAPSDHEWDQETRARTLTALVQAPGRMRFGKETVEVEIELPLPPMPHARIAEALCALDGQLRFEDGRALHARLAPRPRGSVVRGAAPPEE
nr:hypothetical protein [Deltaproteobacteria bacterium]